MASNWELWRELCGDEGFRNFLVENEKTYQDLKKSIDKTLLRRKKSEVEEHCKSKAVPIRKNKDDEETSCSPLSKSIESKTKFVHVLMSTREIDEWQYGCVNISKIRLPERFPEMGNEMVEHIFTIPRDDDWGDEDLRYEIITKFGFPLTRLYASISDFQSETLCFVTHRQFMKEFKNKLAGAVDGEAPDNGDLKGTTNILKMAPFEKSYGNTKFPEYWKWMKLIYDGKPKEKPPTKSED